MAKARSRFNQHLALAEAPNKGHVQRLMESEEARRLLQEALDKSGELVASLEGKLADAEKLTAQYKNWWRMEQEHVSDLRLTLAERKAQPARIEGLINERDGLQRRLDQCLGWIAKSQNKGPFETCEPDAGYPFNNGSR